MAAVRLGVLLAAPLDLTGDETYYWDWGRHPEWGYVSKPPGVAWLTALARLAGADTALGLRAIAVLLGVGSATWLFLLARRLYGPAAALKAGGVFLALPFTSLLNLVLATDVLLVFFWSLSLLAAWRFLQPGASALRWGGLLVLGLAGGLLSKQMMLVFPALLLLFLGLSRGYRAHLRRPALWACLAAALVAVFPTLVWNARHDWATFRHTAHHFEPAAAGLGTLAAVVGGQLALMTPVVWALILALVLAVPWRWARARDPERFLWVFSGPGLLVVVLLGLRQRVHANWPEVYYLAALVLLAGWAAGQWSGPGSLDRWRATFRPGLAVAAATTAAGYVAVGLLSWGWLSLPALNPPLGLRGWSALAGEVETARREVGGDLLLITEGHRYLTSALAFYLPDRPRVYPFQPEPADVRTQYDLWETPVAHLGRDALVIVQGHQMRGDLAARFDAVSLHRVLRYPGRGGREQSIALYVGRGLRRWPAPPPAFAYTAR